MTEACPPIVRNREVIDAYARATELTDCALGLEEHRDRQWWLGRGGDSDGFDCGLFPAMLPGFAGLPE